MKTCVIINPNAGSAEQMDALEKVLNSRTSVECWKSSEAGEGETLARQAAEDGFELVAAAGGDGTINEVVNGLMQARRQPRFGVIPLGTGNDLARTLDVPEDPLDAVALLEMGEVQRLDLIRLVTGKETKFGINVAAGGFSGDVDEVMTSEMKARWGPLAYLIGAATALPDLQEYVTTIAWDEHPRETIEALNIVVANCRTVAGGKPVAPTANPQDGLLDVVIVRRAEVLELAGVTAKLLAGNYLDSPHVVHRRVRQVHIASRPGMWFNVDGELLTQEPITFTVMPAALEVIVGEGYVAEPERVG